MHALWLLAKTSPKLAAERYGIDERYAEKIAGMSAENVEKTCNISHAIFAVRYRETELFSSLDETPLKALAEKDIQTIIRENRNALAIRWASARQSLDESIDLYGMTRNFAAALAASAYSQLDQAACAGHPLLKFNLPENVINLVQQARTPKELTVFMVLHD